MIHTRIIYGIFVGRESVGFACFQAGTKPQMKHLKWLLTQLDNFFKEYKYYI